MTVRRTRWFAVVAALAMLPLMGSGVANASLDAGHKGGPVHKGDPKKWGPPLIKLCSSPEAAKALGYNVIILDNASNSFVGTPLADAIYALGGDDKIAGGDGADVICLGDGNDYGIGDGGNDAVFGEAGDDYILGAKQRDWLDGGVGKDRCDGGPQLDAAVNCEGVINVP